MAPNLTAHMVTETGMSKIEAKLLAILALGVGSFVSGILPLFCSQRNRERFPALISFLLCFGAGVLLATALVHMLPEVRVALKQYAEIIFCLGFFLIYAVDEISHMCGVGHSHGHSHGHGGQHNERASTSGRRISRDSTNADVDSRGYGTSEETKLLSKRFVYQVERLYCHFSQKLFPQNAIPQNEVLGRFKISFLLHTVNSINSDSECSSKI